MREVYIVSATRTPVGKAPGGRMKTVRPDDLAAIVLREVLRRAPGVDPALVEDVILGCAMPEGPQGMNIARIAIQRAGLPETLPGVTVNRFCASGLEAVAIGAQRILSGAAELVIAGGTESMSQVPMGGFKLSPNPCLVDELPDAYLAMGLTAENVSHKFGVSRADQDAFALQSHTRALAAQEAGRFREEIVPVPVREVSLDDQGKRQVRESVCDSDEGPRRDTSAEKLAALKPAFNPKGTVTAGNASQRSDGAAALLLASGETVQRLQLKPIGRFVAYAVAGVAPGIMGIGPVAAIPKVLKQAGLSLDQLDVIELNEASPPRPSPSSASPASTRPGST